MLRKPQLAQRAIMLVLYESIPSSDSVSIDYNRH